MRAGQTCRIARRRSLTPFGATVCLCLAYRSSGWGGQLDIVDLETFAEALKAKFALPGAASPEDQLKPDVAGLFVAAGARYGLTVATRTETHLSEHKVRPDIAIYVGGLICGYVELKAPGLGADAPKLTGGHNKKQWAKLKSLPNLIYTDGREWALYRSGERPDGQPIVRLTDNPTVNPQYSPNASERRVRPW